MTDARTFFYRERDGWVYENQSKKYGSFDTYDEAFAHWSAGQDDNAEDNESGARNVEHEREASRGTL